MNETRRKPTTGRQSPSLFDKWHGIFYMPSRIDEAGHTKAFDYPVAEPWGGKSKNETVPGGIRTHKCSHLWVRNPTLYHLRYPDPDPRLQQHFIASLHEKTGLVWFIGQARIQGGGFGGRDPPLLSTTNFFFFNKLFNYSKNKKKNRSEYSMDAMYLNLMFINPSGPPPLITVNNLGPKPIA